LLEAAAAELPIVATPVGGTSAVVSDNVNGFLVSPDQPDMLDRALRRLLESPDLRHKMGQESKAIVQPYTVEAMTERTLKVYSDAMNRDSRAASKINVEKRDQPHS
jgi:glycosyltransferase involved in cell wall biosynthesis